MSSIVRNLQKEIMSKDADIVNILRNAHLIASKLKLEEFDRWLLYELNGYPDRNNVPEYRKIRGVLKGWNAYQGSWVQTVVSDSVVENTINENTIPNSLSELIALLKSTEDNTLIMMLPGATQKLLNEFFDAPFQLQYALHISIASIEAVIEKVKTEVLDWLIKLEQEGILGEDMSFSNDEVLAAKHVSHTINNFYGDVSLISATADKMQIVSGDNNTVVLDYQEIKTRIDEIYRSLESDDISEEDKDISGDMLFDIDQKLLSNKKSSVIKASLTGLRDFLISAGAGAAADLVLDLIKNCF